ncbi:TPA: polynucleotide adenylyltransferase [Candidatus Dependentiae bacterium]|nr:MAG: Polynucleotide adenylyltransferase/metal dependent phosphohydrolase [candidate division TM6 bacterium GW2011_GWF2_43_87]HBL98604.1 polynucleotide adenylyltransferase [Candidatus Dependentiae bacterium]
MTKLRVEMEVEVKSESRVLSANEAERLRSFLACNDTVLRVVDRLHEGGVRAYLVGGAVRDLVMVRPLKDLDIEVHGIDLDSLRGVLADFGHVEAVGKSFGVLKLFSHGVSGASDWSIPRHDGPGRKPIVSVAPYMDIKTALKRRDLTMNAMAIDLHDQRLFDPFGGEADIQAHRLSCIDPDIFIEDPLRFFRVMQFAARFDMEPDELLNAVCSVMSIKGVSRERIGGEFEKMLMLSSSPSLGIRWLLKVGRLEEVMPELGAIVDINQNPLWHPEGTVFEHTMQVLDAAVLEGSGLDDEDRCVLMFAALCHDLGKVKTTVRQIDGRLTSYGHDQASVPLARGFLARLMVSSKRIKRVCLLVRDHMSPVSFVSTGAKEAAFKRLAIRLAPDVSLVLLARLANADMRGRNGAGMVPIEGPVAVVQEFIDKAKAYGVLEGPELPVIKGVDLREYVESGPLIGKIVRRAYEIQTRDGIVNKKLLMQRIVREFKLQVQKTE